MRSLILLQIVIALISINPAWAQHSQHSESKIQLDHGKKWATDTALRKGMDEINKIIAPHFSNVQENTSNSELFITMANKIDNQIQFIFKNCKLSPKADAQLHILMVQMLDGVKNMKDSSEISKQRLGFLKIVEAINSYGDHFDHPNWNILQRRVSDIKLKI